MKRSSVFYTITFIFALALTSIFLAFLWLMDYDKQNYARELNAKYSTIARNQLFLMSGIINEKEYERQTGDFKMPEITNERQKEEILANATVLEEISADIGSSAIMIYQNHHYLKVRHVDKVLLLKDNDYQPYRYDIIKIIFSLVAIILLAAYVFVIRKLKPLRKLKRQIAKFAAGEIDEVQNVSSGNDEISEVAEAFYDAVCQIKNLNASRKLFLRNIMHELKTPITKGRLAAEMIEKSKNQERLVSVFIKLENLINEFAAVEQVTSSITLNNTKICRIDDVIDEAKTRRGRPTLGVLYDNRVAVLMGDFILSSALVGAIALSDLRIMGIVSAIGRELTEGEIRQFETAEGIILDEATYYDIIFQKTAVLFRSCAEVAAITTEASTEDYDRAARIGTALGMAFQIRDDIFDYYRSDVGKPTGNDIREGKITLPLLHVLTELQKEGKATPYLALLSEKPIPPSSIEQLTTLAHEAGGIDYAWKRLYHYIDEAKTLLCSFPESEYRTSLLALADYIAERTI